MQSIACYPIPGKRKALLMCEAFAAGVRAAGGAATIYSRTPAALAAGASVFYGVRPAVAHLWAQAKAERRDWFYLDNAFFDVSRERHFRVAKNRLQHDGKGKSDGKRFAALGLTVKPWRGGGDYALVCPQSDEFMATVAGDPDWLARTTAGLRIPFVVRRKGNRTPFAEDLSRARCVVTWSSAAAVQALIEGVPAVCAEECAAHRVGNRQAWANVLADNQWTLEEMSKGHAWAHLSA